MSDELFRRVMLYQSTMALMKRARDEGLMTEKEYRRTEEKFARKYGLESSVIYRVNPLIIQACRANIG